MVYACMCSEARWRCQVSCFITLEIQSLSEPAARLAPGDPEWSVSTLHSVGLGTQMLPHRVSLPECWRFELGSSCLCSKELNPQNHLPRLRIFFLEHILTCVASSFLPISTDPLVSLFWLPAIYRLSYPVLKNSNFHLYILSLVLIHYLLLLLPTLPYYCSLWSALPYLPGIWEICIASSLIH